MRITLPRFGETYVAEQLRELVRLLELTFVSVMEDNRRGAITVTSNYELQRQDSLVLVSPVASAAVTITVPAVAQWMIDQKWEWEVKLIDPGTLNLVPVSGTIEGTTGVTTTSVGTSLAIRATEDGWKIV